MASILVGGSGKQMSEKYFESLQDSTKELQVREDSTAQCGTRFLEHVHLNGWLCCELRECHGIHFISLTMTQWVFLSC